MKEWEWQAESNSLFAKILTSLLLSSLHSQDTAFESSSILATVQSFQYRFFFFYIFFFFNTLFILFIYLFL